MSSADAGLIRAWKYLVASKCVASGWGHLCRKVGQSAAVFQNLLAPEVSKAPDAKVSRIQTMQNSHS